MIACASLLQGFGINARYEFEEVGSESVTVPGGTYSARKVTGKGSTESKAMFKSIRIESESTTWVTEDVPFGIVKAITDDVVNGKPQHTETVMVRKGTGAKTRITKPPVVMPNLPFGD